MSKYKPYSRRELLGSPSSFTWYVLEATQATLIACYFFMLHSAFLTYERKAIQHVRGA